MKKRLFALFLALAMLCIAVPLGVLAEDGSDNDFPYGDISGCKDGHTWGEWQTITAATCTEPGEQTHTCAKCGKVETGVIAALGHVEVEEITPATCTEDGKKTVRCSRCNEELFGETLPATGHKFSDWVYADETHHTHTCPSCSTEETEEHTWDKGVITQEPTATEEGVKTFTCTVCHGTKTEAVPPTGPEYTVGDLDGDGKVTDQDAVYLLMYTFYPDDFPIDQPCDFDGDGKVTDQDAVYLLMYTFYPDDFPLE